MTTSATMTANPPPNTAPLTWEERLNTLKTQLASPDQWNQPLLTALRQGALSPHQLRAFMLQYHHYVHRFVGWLSLALAHVRDDRIQALLLPNLDDEIQDSRTGTSHRQLLADLLAAIGISTTDISNSRPLPETSVAERYFWDLLSSGDVIGSLFALGPGTEAVSHCFLGPMEHAIRSVFSPSEESLRYFAVHAPDFEASHVECFDHAICYTLRALDSDSEATWQHGEQTARNAVKHHQLVLSLPFYGD